MRVFSRSLSQTIWFSWILLGQSWTMGRNSFSEPAASSGPRVCSWMRCMARSLSCGTLSPLKDTTERLIVDTPDDTASFLWLAVSNEVPKPLSESWCLDERRRGWSTRRSGTMGVDFSDMVLSAMEWLRTPRGIGRLSSRNGPEDGWVESAAMRVCSN